jgi:hypothetical protein
VTRRIPLTANQMDTLKVIRAAEAWDLEPCCKGGDLQLTGKDITLSCFIAVLQHMGFTPAQAAVAEA